ncbi:SDR family NAD(P)-dependent oxidoreductase [Oceanicella sp. SM1341]|uniref:SDR family NAD(P)-dependent oxidoreductase n=1 Tax=Oceanicella sp. SM1341 TaxID=1548889 RepID=UPI000E496F2A|nr:SDR family oxidoreductase [Oceanicella sp. SM1341]
MRRFEDRCILVTGAASGIGAAAARRFSREGGCVMLADRSREVFARARSLPAERSAAVRCDVSRAEEVKEMVAATLRRFGRIDVLVNNAGYPVTDATDEISDETWRAHFETDVHGLRLVCNAALPSLVRRRGNIVNTTSVAGLGGDRAMAAYDAAKGAAVRLTNALAIDLGARGVRANAVCPTLTRTRMSRRVEENPEQIAAFRRAIPLRRIAEPGEVAAAIAFLASDDASFITGVALPVDGGVTAGNGQPQLV